VSAADIVLIVEPSDDGQALFHAAFDAEESFRMILVSTGAEVLEAALKHRPKLILMEAQLPDKPGMAIFRQLQLYTRTAHIPVIFLAGGTELVLRNQILSAGAYDVIPKPIDVAIISPRLKNALHRARNDGRLHPETRLPTGQFLSTLLSTLPQDPPPQQFSIQVAHYEAFKDQYGFIAAREVIQWVGNAISEVVHELGNPADIIGHRQENDFLIAVTQAAHSDSIQSALTSRLNDQLPQFYNFAERDQGYLEAPDGAHIPLMSLTIQNIVPSPAPASDSLS
jgi:DNA-binding response OmpR family regulator